MLATLDNTQVIKDVLRESFSAPGQDGFWYPMEAGIPLVRVQVANSGYSIERRRNERSSWMPIVTRETQDFDPASFRQWRSHWPMTA